jgi:hypothetical protein
MADRMISCDDHMDLGQLPADLWLTGYPRCATAPASRRDGQAVWICDGKVWGLGRQAARDRQPTVNRSTML